MTDIHIKNADSPDLDEITKNINGLEPNLGKKNLFLLTDNYVDIG